MLGEIAARSDGDSDGSLRRAAAIVPFLHDAAHCPEVFDEGRGVNGHGKSNKQCRSPVEDSMAECYKIHLYIVPFLTVASG